MPVFLIATALKNGLLIRDLVGFQVLTKEKSTFFPLADISMRASKAASTAVTERKPRG